MNLTQCHKISCFLRASLSCFVTFKINSKEVRLKEMMSQTAKGLFLTIDLVACVESNN